jgi:glycosyltransferase involved in cell wall biosynthesis
MTPAPVVSCILPVHDGAAYVREAVESILTQTFADFELIVVDDVSSDRTPEILASIGDPRLRIVRSETRGGIAGSCNRAIALARGRYIARMDHDDVSLPQRFARQVAFLDAHPDVAICGTWVRMFSGGWQRDRKLEADSQRIRCLFLMFNVLSHPSVMIRRDVLERHALRYDETFESAEDYDLWTRTSWVSKLSNIPQVLLLHRVHPAQISQRGKPRQLDEADFVRNRELERLGVRFEADEAAFHRALYARDLTPNEAWLAPAERWLTRILAANERTRLFDPRVLTAALLDHVLLTYARVAGVRPASYRPFLRGKLRRAIEPDALLSLAWRAITGRIDDRRRLVTSPPASAR